MVVCGERPTKYIGKVTSAISAQDNKTGPLSDQLLEPADWKKYKQYDWRQRFWKFSTLLDVSIRKILLALAK